MTVALGRNMKIYFAFYYQEFGYFLSVCILKTAFLTSLLLPIALQCLIFQSFVQKLNIARPELQDEQMKGKEEGWLLKDQCTYLFQITVCLGGFFSFEVL